MNDRNSHQLPKKLILAVALSLLGIVGGGTIAWLTSQNSDQPVSQTPNLPSITPTQPTSEPTISPSQTPNLPSITPTQPTSEPTISPESPVIISEKAIVYLPQAQANKIILVPQEISIKPSSKAPEAILSSTLQTLFLRSEKFLSASDIPDGTKLQNLTIKGDHIYLDLSPEFTTGGGSNSMINRLGQVIYTATNLQPNAKVWLSINQKPLTLLGGEGLEIPQPITRQIFTSEFQ